jgi:putative DNA primase/helicase
MACLTNAGVSSPAKFVDAALKESRSEDGIGEGRQLLFTDLEPWPDPVDGEQLLCEFAAFFERFAVVQKGGTCALSLWVLHTYALAAAYISPILAIVSPEKRCGKTVLLDALFRLAWRAITVANITAASLFRAVEKWTPTLLVDEADSFLAGNEELRGVINSGHRRDTAKVIRTVGDEHEPRVFSTWGPKAIALIGRLPATLEDRAIVLPMKRKTSGERVERFRPERIVAELEVIRRKAGRWAADNLETLRESDPTIPEVLNDRAQDNWRPLLAIADAAGGSWPHQARKAAILLSSQENAGETSAAVQLLADLRDFFQNTKQDFLSSEDVVAKLLEMEERPWGEWKKGKAITKIQVAAILRKFGVRPKQTWLDSSPSRGYELADFNDAFSRYLPSESVDSVGTNDDRGLSDVFDSVGNDIHTDSEKRPKGPSIKESTDSTDSKPRYEANDSLHEEGERGLLPFAEGKTLPLEELEWEEGTL